MVEPGERTPDGRRARWATHRAERRAEFVAAGAAAVDRFGADVSAEQIAEVALISRTVLYRYFRDRDDLRQAVGEYVVNELTATVSSHLHLKRVTKPRCIIETTVGAIVDWFAEYPNRYYFLRALQNGSIEQVNHRLADQVADLLKYLMTIFGLDSAQAEPTAYGVIGLIESSAAWWLDKRPMSQERLTEMLSDSVWVLIDRAARTLGQQIGYDDPLPLDRAIAR